MFDSGLKCVASSWFPVLAMFLYHVCFSIILQCMNMWLKHFFYSVHFTFHYSTHWHLFKSWLYWSVLAMCFWISLPLMCLFTPFFLPLQNHKMPWLHWIKHSFFFSSAKGHTCQEPAVWSKCSALCQICPESFKSIVGTIKLWRSGLPQFCYLSPWKY